MPCEDFEKGTFIVMVGKEDYPKIKLEKGYHDIRFGVTHLQPDTSWEFMELSEEEVKETLEKTCGSPNDEFLLGKALQICEKK